jgi:Uma2 family endonuclease
VNGEIVETEPMGAYATWIASLLLQALAGQQSQGRAVMEMLFDFTKSTGRKRRPDLAFVAFGRWPRERKVPVPEGWEVVPNLAVEVVSPTNPADEVIDKVSEYFTAGVERVWVIYPLQRQVYAYKSPTDITVLAGNDELTDASLFPGFRVTLGELFDETRTSG